MKPPLAWDVPLESPPEVVAIGRNAHGFAEPSDQYRLPDLWSLHLYGYRGALRLDGQPVEIRPGSVGLTPPDTLMEYRYVGLSVHLYVHFRLSPGPTRRVAAIQDVGGAYETMHDRLYEAVGLFAQDPRRTVARVWDVLWEVASLTGESPVGGTAHSAVRRVHEIIERHLDEPLTVAELARAVDVSPSYLVRLFRTAYRESVVGHIRRRRMERADHLLRHSTLPIKAIAASVGLPDLQHFNKAVRTTFGVSPRERRGQV